jgi:cell division protein FtsL
MIASLFHRRVRGFRIIDLIALFCLSVLVLGVYFAKAAAGRESARINEVNQNIQAEQKQLRLLRAELAHLESPARIERLSQAYLGLAPENAKHETSPDNLVELARGAGVQR